MAANRNKMTEAEERQAEMRACLSAPMMPQTLNVEARTVDIVFFTGVDVPRYDWWKDEPFILRFDPKGADLSLLNNGAPVFDNHDSCDGAESQKGVVDKAWKDGTDFKATLRFSRRLEVAGLWQDIQDKIVQKFSMGVSLVEKTDLARKEGELRIVFVTKWQPYEISVAPLPADFDTGTLSRVPERDSGLAVRRREIEIAKFKAQQ